MMVSLEKDGETIFGIYERAMDGLRMGGLPEHMHGGVIRWLCHGINPGSFMTAVISNDLRGAVMRADDENSAVIKEWVRFFYNHAPAGSWGSPDRVDEWPGTLRAIRERETETKG